MAIVVKSMATSGVDGFMVEIEASTIRGQQQGMFIIGLPDQAIKEAGELYQGFCKGNTLKSRRRRYRYSDI